MKKTVCLVGKPNVGKSTIFNRLIKEDKAIVMDTPGITRDRIYGEVHYNEKSFLLIDTGGLDGNEDLTVSDFKIRNRLLKSNKKVFVVVNKVDNEKRLEGTYQYYELGFSDLFSVSASHDLGFKELLEAVTREMEVETESEDFRLKFCFIGRPNVGKSSLINAVLNEERVIVSSIAGTTRDATDTTFFYNHEEYVMIDTAGMRKKYFVVCD